MGSRINGNLSVRVPSFNGGAFCSSGRAVASPVRVGRRLDGSSGVRIFPSSPLSPGSPFRRPAVFIKKNAGKRVATVVLENGNLYRTEVKEEIDEFKRETKGKSWAFLNPSSKMVQKAKEVSEATTGIFRGVEGGYFDHLQDKQRKKIDRLNKGIIQSVIYFTGDIPPTMAVIDSIAHGCMGGDPALQSTGFRFLSTLGVISGACGISGANNALKVARLIGDIDGIREAKIRIARGSFEITSGFLAGGLRSLSAVSLQETAKSVVTAKMALGHVATGVGAILYTLIAVPFAIRMKNSCQFIKKLNQEINKPGKNDFESVVEGSKFLMNQLTMQAEDYEEAANILRKKKPAELYKIAADSLTLNLEDYCKSSLAEERELSAAEQFFLTDEERKKVEDKASQLTKELEEKKEFSEISDWKHMEKRAIPLALAMETIRIKKLKETNYRRNAGAESLARIKAEIAKPESERFFVRLAELMEKNSDIDFSQPLEEVVQSLYDKDRYDEADEVIQCFGECKEIIEVSHAETRKNIILYMLIIITCIVGIGAMAFSSIVSGGIAPVIVSIIMSVITSGLMFGLDLQDLIEKAKSMTSSGVKDKIVLGIIMMLTLASTILGVYFASSTVVQIIIALAGATILGIQGSTMAISWKNHKTAEQQAEEVENTDNIAHGLPLIPAMHRSGVF